MFIYYHIYLFLLLLLQHALIYTRYIGVAFFKLFFYLSLNFCFILLSNQFAQVRDFANSLQRVLVEALERAEVKGAG